MESKDKEVGVDVDLTAFGFTKDDRTIYLNTEERERYEQLQLAIENCDIEESRKQCYKEYSKKYKVENNKKFKVGGKVKVGDDVLRPMRMPSDREATVLEHLKTRFLVMLNEDAVTLKDDLQVAVHCFSNSYPREVFYYNNIEYLAHDVAYGRSDFNFTNYDVYIKGLISAHKKGLKDENIVCRTDIVLDFDNSMKGLNQIWSASEIDEIFKRLKVKYTMITSSGHGLHVYVTLKRAAYTDADLLKVKEVTKKLADIVKADGNACSISNNIRLSGTFNNKYVNEGKAAGYVSIVKNHARSADGTVAYESNGVYGYDLDALYNNFVVEDKTSFISKSERAGVLRDNGVINLGISKCESKWMSEGAKKGERNDIRGKLFSLLHYRGLNKEAILEQMLKFNSLCKPEPEKEDIVTKQVEYMWNRAITKRCSGGQYVGCDKCTDETCCFKNSKMGEGLLKLKYEPINELEFYDIKELITYNKKTVERQSGGGKKSMNSQEFLVYSMINYWKKLTYARLVKELSCKKKCLYTDRKLKSLLKSLIEKGYLEESDGVYKLKRKRVDATDNFGVAYSAILKCCVQRVINEEQTQFYVYLKSQYLEEYRLGLASGGYYYVDVAKLAEGYGKCVSTIYNYLEELDDCSIISRLENSRKDKHGTYYEYRLHF